MSTAIPTPTAAAIDANGGIEVVDKAGRTKLITGAKLRNLNAETIGAIADKFGSDRIAELLDELTKANCITNGGREIADNKTRLQALTLTLAYLIGRPVERQEVISVNLDADSSIGLAERLQNSPALLKSLKGIIAQVEGAEIVAK